MEKRYGGWVPASWLENHKRVHQLYREEVLSLRHTKRNRRHLDALRKVIAGLPQQMNECSTMDFVSDSLFDGRSLRALTILDMFTRENLATEVGKSLRGEDVVAALSRIFLQRGKPIKIRCGNGTEFISRTWIKWTYEHVVAIKYSRPGADG